MSYETINKKLNSVEIGVREDLIGKLEKCQRGPATVLGSESTKCHWSVSFGKAWRNNDLEPGELPV